ncbi:MAG: SoxR reducing system RseC family protein [Bacteroidales bacterium]|nr:SoxR reducing system RseC family protein [Bacteroidales bacterium]
MDGKEIIEHEAIIKDIKEYTYEAEIIAIAGCASCQLKRVCSVSDIKEKTIIVQKENKKAINVGDKVTIYIAESKGFKAVFLGYILPFLFVLTTLIVVLFLTGNDGIAGIASITILAPYYLILYLLKDKIEKNYKFRIKE